MNNKTKGLKEEISKCPNCTQKKEYINNTKREVIGSLCYKHNGKMEYLKGYLKGYSDGYKDKENEEKGK